MADNDKTSSGGVGRSKGRKQDRNKGHVSLSEAVLRGLFVIHRYRLLSADQFAKVAMLNPVYARDQLRTLERKHLLGSIGNVGLRGGSKAPKLYFLTRSGYAEMLDAGGVNETAVGPFVKPHTSTKWSPIMAHRVGTIDLLVAAETALYDDPTYDLVATLHEYRRVPVGRSMIPETSDQITDQDTNRIVPDGAFVLAHKDRGSRGLFFVECDRGTERLTTTQEAAYSVSDKLAKYERYLLGGRFAETYRRFGAFTYATVLFVTTTPRRITALREAASRLDPRLHQYFRLSTMDAAMGDFFGGHWHSRDRAIQDTKPLLKERG